MKEIINILTLKKVVNQKLQPSVGMTGFEPATPSSRTTYATGLRYIPNLFKKSKIKKDS